MRSPESSPFTPGRPAPHDVFVGRSAQLEALRVMSARAAQGKFELGFVTGERGIGKSSLASLARDRAEVQNGVVGAHVNLSDVDELGKAAAGGIPAERKQQARRVSLFQSAVCALFLDRSDQMRHGTTKSLSGFARRKLITSIFRRFYAAYFPDGCDWQRWPWSGRLIEQCRPTRPCGRIARIVRPRGYHCANKSLV